MQKTLLLILFVSSLSIVFSCGDYFSCSCGDSFSCPCGDDSYSCACGDGYCFDDSFSCGCGDGYCVDDSMSCGCGDESYSCACGDGYYVEDSFSCGCGDGYCVDDSMSCGCGDGHELCYDEDDGMGGYNHYCVDIPETTDCACGDDYCVEESYDCACGDDYYVDDSYSCPCGDESYSCPCGDGYCVEESYNCECGDGYCIDDSYSCECGDDSLSCFCGDDPFNCYCTGEDCLPTQYCSYDNQCYDQPCTAGEEYCDGVSLQICYAGEPNDWFYLGPVIGYCGVECITDDDCAPTDYCDNFVCKSTSFSCVGPIDGNAVMYYGDNSDLISNTTNLLVTANTERKCEWYCKSGYIKQGNSCVINPVESEASCGSAAKEYLIDEIFPLGDLCNTGTSNPSIISLGNEEGDTNSWVCLGTQDANCTAKRVLEITIGSDDYNYGYNSILDFNAQVLPNGFLINTKCTVNTKADLKIFDSMNYLLKGPLVIDCDKKYKSVFVDFNFLNEKEGVLTLQADISRTTSPCVVCKKQVSISYKVETDPSSIPDNNPVLVVLVLIITGLIVRRKRI